MRIVLSSAWYPVCVGVHLARAARRLGHEVRTVGPTSGDEIPWESPTRFEGRGVVPDVPTIGAHNGIETAAVVRVAEWSELWIDVDGGWFLPLELPTTRRRVLVVTDPHIGDVAEGFAARTQRAFFAPSDVFVMQSPYARPGECWLPYGFDPEWFFPDPDVACDADVTNLGAPYPERVEITEELRRRGLVVLGPRRDSMGDAHRRQLCRAPEAVVWPVRDDLPGRVFEAAACGAHVFTKAVPDAWRIGGMGITFGVNLSMGSLIEAVARQAKRVGPRAAFSLASPAHSWDARLQQIIDGRRAP
jgi:hypothetical protein